MTAAIAITGLTKSFGPVRALDGLDMTVATGEIHGFLGPNGAGKTTTLRILLGLLKKDGGQVTLLGGDPWHDATELHRRLAYVPGDVMLWPNLTGGEVIDLLGRLRGGLDAGRRADLLERLDLIRPRRAAPTEGEPAEGGVGGGAGPNVSCCCSTSDRGRPIDGGDVP
jgi:ABC-2 type transport system ATP-binding protein